MTAPSNANTSGLDCARIVACHLPEAHCPDTVCLPITITAGDLRAVYESLVTAASAQAEITSLTEAVRRAEINEAIWSDLADEHKARADRLAKALETLEAERKREGVNLAHLKRAVAVAYADMNRAAPTGAK